MTRTPAAKPATMIGRRALLATVPGLFIAGPASARSQPGMFTVYKTPWCGCCGGWVRHMVAAGWTPTVVEVEDLAPIRAQRGVPATLASCHTAVVGRYVVEGHVPAADVTRLLGERPDAVGIVVPGMPVGSPGMESAGRAQPFQTLLILRDGGTRVFAQHG